MSGPRVAAGGPTSGARRDKSPGDLSGRVWQATWVHLPVRGHQNDEELENDEIAKPTACRCCCLPAGDLVDVAGSRRKKERIQYRLDDLCRLDAVALCG